ncbi:MAG: DNA-binding protein [Pseudohongiella sp.]|nr:DNA-binding protein [Pseudohongiella sp.]
MARSGVQFEQVAAVADSMVGEGKLPTIRSVREILGTGSDGTIHKHLRAWHAARPPVVVVPPKLPEVLISAIAAEISKAAASARGEIEGRLVEAQSAADDLANFSEALENEKDALLEQVSALTRERDVISGRADQQAADIVECKRTIEREQQSADNARAELATIGFKVSSQQERLAEQSAELQSLRAELAIAQSGRIQAEQQAAVAIARLEVALERAAKSDSKIEYLEAELDRRSKSLEDFRKSAAVEIREIQSERDAALKLGAQAREQVAHLAGRMGFTKRIVEGIEEVQKNDAVDRV